MAVKIINVDLLTWPAVSYKDLRIASRPLSCLWCSSWDTLIGSRGIALETERDSRVHSNNV